MSGNVAPKIVLDGLILYLDAANIRSYPGTGTVWTDLTDNKFNGTLTNGPTFTSDNLGGIVFDGVDDYVENGVINLTSGDNITIDLFMKLDGTQVSYADILDYDHANGGFVIQQDAGAAADDFYFAWYVGGYYFSFFKLPIDNTYFHLSITKNAGTVYAYINGIQDAGSTGGSTLTATGLDLRIGNWVNNGRNIKGTLSNLKIYNRTLTSNEVLQNYNAFRSRFGL
jgi:hypothetical protein